VVITLINVATNATRTTTTGDNGQFEFLDVAAGNYRIVQTQPQAYIDGGSNDLTVTLAVGQNLANQNFREIGLRAAYVYNRLAITSTLPVGSAAWIATLRTINGDATAVASSAVADDAEVASTQAFSGGGDSAVQPNVQSTPQANSVLASTEPVLLPSGSLDPIISPQFAPLGQTQAKDDEDKQLPVDDAMTQTGLW